MAHQDLLRPVKLFDQHDTGQTVWPGHAAEGECCRRAVEQRLAVAVRAANGKGEIGDTVIAPPANAPPAKYAARR